MSIAVILLLCTAPAFAAPVPKELRKEEKIQGSWKVESLVNMGRSSAENLIWTIDADGNLARHAPGVDPATAPKTIVLKQNREEKHLDYHAGNMVYLGTYRLVGDTLEFCLAQQNDPRPGGIEATPRNYLWTLKRVQPGDKLLGEKK